MATTLQHLIPVDAPRLLGQQLSVAGAGLRPADFARAAGGDFNCLGLMDRGRRLAEVLARYLPPAFPEAAGLLVASMGGPMGLDERGEPVASGDVPSGFFYLPHSFYIAAHGLDHLDEAVAAQHALTQRFTAEFSLRAFLRLHTRDTLRHLARWAQDSNAHVRRAVSESTRPRLPWAPRLQVFVDDPSPVLPLLAQLRDDPSAYVRRSVANHLNDIGKDHPQRLLSLAREWLGDEPVPDGRRALLRHALRTAIKRGDAGALALFGHAGETPVRVIGAGVAPPLAQVGSRVQLQCELHNPGASEATVLADWRVHYVKSDGRGAPKVFKGRTVTLAAGERLILRKTLSLRQMSTRVHHPGRHRVEIVLNGQAHPVGHFDLEP